MKAVVLERAREIAIRDIELPTKPGPDDVLVDVHTVGICGSDVHYYTHGRIGPFIVEAPMVLGHEASGTVCRVGSRVTKLRPGDRVCMEPGVPDFASRATRLGVYNVDSAVRFWATPPIHGCLTSQVVHPAAFTFRMPDTVTFAEGAMVEPFAVGMHAVNKAGIRAGDVAVVLGAGPIGIMSALALLATGCSSVVISDPIDEKLSVAATYPNVVPVNPVTGDLPDTVRRITDGWGADVLVEASGSPHAFKGLFDLIRPAGVAVLVGMPIEAVSIDVVEAQAREIRIETVFRYANVFDRALNLIASGAVDLKPLISETFAFDGSVAAFERAAKGNPTDVKLQIKVAD